MQEAMKRLAYRVGEAADTLGISRSQAYRLIAEGRLPSIKVGGSVRVPARALEKWIEKEMKDGIGA